MDTQHTITKEHTMMQGRGLMTKVETLYEIPAAKGNPEVTVSVYDGAHSLTFYNPHTEDYLEFDVVSLAAAMRVIAALEGSTPPQGSTA